MEALATVARVSARVGEPIASDDEIALAEAMLSEASAWVRHHSGQTWAELSKAPEVAVAITAAAASRGYLNPAGFDMERGDMSTFNRVPEYAAGTQLTRSEIDMLRPFNRRSGIVSIGLVNPDRPRPRGRGRAWEDRGYARDSDGMKPFPLGIEPNLPLEEETHLVVGNSLPAVAENLPTVEGGS